VEKSGIFFCLESGNPGSMCLWEEVLYSVLSCDLISKIHEATLFVTSHTMIQGGKFSGA